MSVSKYLLTPLLQFICYLLSLFSFFSHALINILMQSVHPFEFSFFFFFILCCQVLIHQIFVVVFFSFSLLLMSILINF